MFQPPPGPTSAPSPVAKQPGAGGVGVNVQQPSNPYSQGLYGPQSGYDDYQQHHHSQHQHQPAHQHSHSLALGQGGVGSGEYGKQLYGGAGQGAMQGFMGLGGQGAGSASGVPTSNAGGPRSSPETPYKPYAPKDSMGVAGNRGAAGQQQSQVQPQPQGQGQSQGGQGPQGQGFYGGARFGGAGAGVGVGGGVSGPQQSVHHPQGGPQGHLGYPQGANDGGFYPYQRQQPGYWQ